MSPLYLPCISPVSPLHLTRISPASPLHLLEVRSTGAKALGRLCAGLGEDQIPQLLPWLLGALCHDGAAVERAGRVRVRVALTLTHVSFLTAG